MEGQDREDEKRERMSTQDLTGPVCSLVSSNEVPNSLSGCNIDGFGLAPVFEALDDLSFLDLSGTSSDHSCRLIVLGTNIRNGFDQLMDAMGAMAHLVRVDFSCTIHAECL